MTSPRQMLARIPGARFAYRGYLLWLYRPTLRRKPRVGLRYLFRGREVSTFSFELENLDEMVAWVADALEAEQDAVWGYVRELREDRELHEMIARKWRPHRRREDVARFGSRQATYAVVRLAKPGVVVETGTHDGLGSAAILRALERNAAEGSPGRLLAFDINPDAGWLIEPPLRDLMDRFVGDTRETLPNALETHGVDMFVHDIGGGYEAEMFEFETALAHARGARLILTTDDAQRTPALKELAERLGARYRSYKERPLDHFFPGDAPAIGMFELSGTEER